MPGAGSRGQLIDTWRLIQSFSVHLGIVSSQSFVIVPQLVTDELFLCLLLTLQLLSFNFEHLRIFLWSIIILQICRMDTLLFKDTFLHFITFIPDNNKFGVKRSRLSLAEMIPLLRSHSPKAAELGFKPPGSPCAHLHHLQHPDFLVRNQLITEALILQKPLGSLPGILHFLLPVSLGLQALTHKGVQPVCRGLIQVPGGLHLGGD